MKIRRLTKRRGGAAIEFALLLPIFVMLLSAILDYGYYFYVKSSATQAVRNGVRMAVTKQDVATMNNLAWQHTRNALADFNVVCIEAEGCKGIHKHTALTYDGETFVNYELTLILPFEAPMGMVAVPTSHNISYAMRYEY